MHRLTLTDYLLTIIIVCAIAFGLAYGLRGWLLQVNDETSGRIERAGKIFQ